MIKDEFMASNFLKKFKTKINELKYDLSALYLAYKRKDVSIYAKIIIIIAIVYALSPIDLIPDFIPIIGYLDDILIVGFLVYLSLKLIPKEIMIECRQQAEDLWEEGKPKKWYYALPVVVIYLLIILILINTIFF